MLIYRYQGRRADGSPVSGKLEAVSDEIAAETLMSRGVIPIKLSRLKESQKEEGSFLSKMLSPAVPLEMIILFSRQLYSLTKAGVPILRAMRGLLQNTDNPQLKYALEDVTNELSNGRGLSAAMRNHPRVFSSLFVSMVAVGENTGRLDQALLQLAIYYEQELETRKRIKAAMRYPSFVIIFIAIAMFILNLFVIPQFAEMFMKFNVELPLPTKILIGTSNFFVNYWGWLIAMIIGGTFGFRAWLATAVGREIFDKSKLRVPVVGEIVNRAQLSRFSRTFSLMLQSGVPLNDALALAGESLGNKYLENRILGMKSSIEAGSTISVTAVNSQIFTPLVLQMIAVGEETGRIDELLLEVSEYYDREVDYDLKSLTARIEPILLALIAGMVGILALGIFLPMWGMLDIIKG